MDDTPRKAIPYKRSHFATQLPAHYLYTPSHAWLDQTEGDLWRVGLTKFATRMLGEIVDHGFNLEAGSSVQAGQIIGWIEGFKAISDLYCVVNGQFAGSNPGLKEEPTLVNRDPYARGWLYQARGRPDEVCVGVEAYVAILDKTIDRILEREKKESD